MISNHEDELMGIARLTWVNLISWHKLWQKKVSLNTNQEGIYALYMLLHTTQKTGYTSVGIGPWGIYSYLVVFGVALEPITLYH